MKILIGALMAAMALCGTALAADAIYVPPPEDVVFEEGPSPTVYFGVHGGWGWGFADHTSGAPPGWPNGYDISLEGWFLGGQAGVNIPVGDSGLFIGFEVDGSWSEIEGAIATGGAPGTIEHDIEWFASARGKIGFDAMGFRPYLTGGLAAAGIEREASCGACNSDSNIQTGWTGGLGLDVPVAEMVTLNFEWRYSDYGSAVFDTGGIPATIATTAHTVRAGLNLEF